MLQTATVAATVAGSGTWMHLCPSARRGWDGSALTPATNPMDGRSNGRPSQVAGRNLFQHFPRARQALGIRCRRGPQPVSPVSQPTASLRAGVSTGSRPSSPSPSPCRWPMRPPTYRCAGRRGKSPATIRVQNPALRCIICCRRVLLQLAWLPWLAGPLTCPRPATHPVQPPCRVRLQRLRLLRPSLLPPSACVNHRGDGGARPAPM